jgi:hypothetical protein
MRNGGPVLPRVSLRSATGRGLKPSSGAESRKARPALVVARRGPSSARFIGICPHSGPRLLMQRMRGLPRSSGGRAKWRWAFHPEPGGAPPRAIGRALALRDDAFEAEPAGVLKYHRPVAVEVSEILRAGPASACGLLNGRADLFEGAVGTGQSAALERGRVGKEAKKRAA